MSEVIKEINWLDALFFLTLAVMVYRGAKSGVGAQLLSLAGWVSMLYLSVRYYVFVSEALFGFMLQNWARPLSFVAISAMVFVVVKLLERVFSVVLGDELSMVERLGGAVVGAVRSSILLGMIGFVMLTLPFGYARSSVEGAISARSFMKFDAVVYGMVDSLFTGAGSKKENGGPFQTIMEGPSE